MHLGPFQLHEIIGRGGMAEVWRGEHQGQGTPVAVKVLSRRTPGRLASFGNEARAVARLSHPAIIHLLDYGQIPAGTFLPEGSPYLVMELASHGSLRDHALPLAWEQTRAILRTLLDALAHAHARGVIHRDIKPGNVLLAGPDDTRPGLKLSDFGIAQGLHEAKKGTQTAGTPNYMAPEQIQGRWAELGPWTDLYSLGCLAWTLVTGHPPYRASRKRHVVAAHLRAPLPDLPAGLAVPEGLDRWLWRLLQKSSWRRFSRAADARAALDALGEAPPPPADAPPVPTPAEALSTEEILEIVSQPLEGVDDRPLAPQPRPALPPSWRQVLSAPPMALVGAGLGLYGLRTVPLAGREAERDALWEALGRVHEQGRAEAVILQGPAGAGKTRLARWLCERAHEVGAAGLLRSNHGQGAAGLVGMLYRHLRVDSRGDARQTRARVERVLRKLGSEDPWEWCALSALLLAQSPSQDLEDCTVRLQEVEEAWGALARYLHRLASRRPLILHLDDAHGAPEATGFTRYLLEEHPDLPVLCLLTARRLPEEPVASLSSVPGVSVLPIRPLGPEDQPRLVRGLLGLEGSLARQVEERTGGIPLFAVQLVGDWVQRGVLVPGDHGFVLKPGEQAVLPDDIHTLWTTRLAEVALEAELDPAPLLELAAVLGLEVDLELWSRAAELAGLPSPEPLLGWLTRARLLEVDRGEWSLAHAMLQESLVRCAREAGRLTGAHAACATALEELRPERLDDRARHLVHAGEHARALSLLHQAMERRLAQQEAARALDLLELARACHQALQLPESHPRRVEGYLYAARALVALDRLDEASTQAKRAAQVARGSGHVQHMAQSLLALGRVRRWAGQPALAEANLHRSLALAERIDDPVTVLHSLRQLAVVCRLQGRADEAWVLARRALSLLPEGGSLPRATLLLDLARIAVDQERTDSAEEYARLALGLFDLLGARWGGAEVRNTLGNVARLRGDLDLAATEYRRSLVHCEAMGSGRAALVPSANLALTELLQGRHAPALLRAESIALEARRRGLKGHETMASTLQLAAHAGLGEWKDFDQDLRRLWQQLERSRLREADLALALVLAADLALAGGEPRRARRALRMAELHYRALERGQEAENIRARVAAMGRPSADSVPSTR